MNWQERDGAIWVEAAALSRLSPGVPQQAVLSPSMPGWKSRQDLEVFIIAQVASTTLVLSNQCPHQGCPVDWKGDRFSCPCHGSAFNQEGAVLNGPATNSLARHQTMVEGDTLWVKVKDK